MSTSYTAAGFAIRKLCHLAERPTLPEISDDMLVSGEWAATLVNLVSPYADELADLLGAAWPPGHDALRGQRSASERVEAALRVIDAADLSLQRAARPCRAQPCRASASAHGPDRGRQDPRRAGRAGHPGVRRTP